MDEIRAIAYSLSKEWNYQTKKKSIEEAGSFEDLVRGLGKKLELLDLKTAEKQVKKLKAHGGWLWVYGQANYPQTLAKIIDPPLVVYGRGQQAIDQENTLAFIGTRHPTPYGNRIARLLAKDLVREGITLVSGLARGIDSIGHKVSIEAKAPTVAVVAHGLDIVYPPENKKLAEDILNCDGSMISEFPFGIQPLPAYFSQRNRIISGLSKSVLVIEATEKSGTRHTVTHALEQCREVFSVPGPIDSEFSAYTNELIFSGANMVRTSLDILHFYPHRKTRSKIIETGDNPKIQSELLRFLDKDTAKSLDEIISVSKVEARSVLQTMTELELAGLVKRCSDSTYILIS